jgi:hypothetical protein
MDKSKLALPASLMDAMKEAERAGLYNGVRHQKKRAYLLALSFCGNVTHRPRDGLRVAQRQGGKRE